MKNDFNNSLRSLYASKVFSVQWIIFYRIYPRIKVMEMSKENHRKSTETQRFTWKIWKKKSHTERFH